VQKIEGQEVLSQIRVCQKLRVLTHEEVVHDVMRFYFRFYLQDGLYIVHCKRVAAASVCPKTVIPDQPLSELGHVHPISHVPSYHLPYEFGSPDNLAHCLLYTYSFLHHIQHKLRVFSDLLASSHKLT
jgi:hypothetical protein